MTIDPRPDQQTDPPAMVVAPGGAAGIFKGRLVIVFGTGFSGVFVYSPSPGPGNLVASVAALAGTDPYGNKYPAGVSSQTGGIEAILSGSRLSWDAPADSPTGLPEIFATPSAASGNSLEITSNVSAGGVTAGALTIYDSAASSTVPAIPSGSPGIFVAGGCPMVTDTWHSMGTMSNGWAVGGFAKYRMTPQGDVELAFQDLTTGTTVDTTVLWTSANGLPSAYRPSHTARLVCYTDVQRVVSGSNNESCALLIGTDGSVQCFGVAAAATRVDLFATLFVSV